jgi:hypothetical protein
LHRTASRRQLGQFGTRTRRYRIGERIAGKAVHLAAGAAVTHRTRRLRLALRAVHRAVEADMKVPAEASSYGAGDPSPSRSAIFHNAEDLR